MATEAKPAAAEPTKEKEPKKEEAEEEEDSDDDLPELEAAAGGAWHADLDFVCSP